MSRSAIARSAASWIASAAIVACGGTTGIGAASDGGVGGGDGGIFSASPCPSSMPSDGDACAISPSIACEYGSDVDSACNRTAVCAQGAWTLSATSANAKCPTPAASSTCPDYATADGQSCDTLDVVCGYPQGRCACEPPPRPASPSQGFKWACDAAGAGCPSPRPRLGSTCASDGLFCDYGTCTLADGIAEQCTNGLWETTATACPALARPR